MGLAQNLTRLCCLAIWLLGIGIQPPAEAAEKAAIDARVVGIIDGDTIDVRPQDGAVLRLRLAGIDAPEKRQPFGQEAKAALSHLAYSKEVRVVPRKRDRYGRLIAKVLVPSAGCVSAAACHEFADISRIQIAAGMAWWYRRYANEQSAADRAAYEGAEQNARDEKIGLWAQPEAVAPWDWRRKKPSKKEDRSGER